MNCIKLKPACLFVIFFILGLFFGISEGSFENDILLETFSKESNETDLESNIKTNFKDTVVFENNSDDCDCGVHSTKCEVIDGLKECTCEKGFVSGVDGFCTAMCSDSQKCHHGGTCFNGICLCPPRTMGDHCELKHLNCYTTGYQKKAGYRGQACCCEDRLYITPAECLYDENKQDVYCKCKNEGDVYEDNSDKCIECNCGKKGTWTKCDFYNGVKTCFCNKNYEFNPKTQACEPCECGSNSIKCEFSWSGATKCICPNGYMQWKNTCLECNCGKNGYCRIRDGKPICHCDENAQNSNGTCLECDCGKFGKCVYDESGKIFKCECDLGYSEISGKCEYCYCGDDSSCTFNSTGNKTCTCSNGFENINGFCFDIDECLQKNVCPPTEKCINMPGSYTCGCADGYIHTSSGCSDIDECGLPNICVSENTECQNTPGSYECKCKSGYLSQGGGKEYLACADDSAYKIGYGLLGVMLISLGYWIIFVKKC